VAADAGIFLTEKPLQFPAHNGSALSSLWLFFVGIIAVGWQRHHLSLWRLSGRQAGRRAGRQAGRQAGRPADEQKGRQLAF
jgi:hypothetical protein